MDWNGKPDAASEQLRVSVWHDIVQENITSASADLPGNEDGEKPGDLVTVWQPNDVNAKPDLVTFTQANLAAAIAALLTALPLRQRFTSADLVLPASSFDRTYVLLQTMAALVAHASVAVTSVAGPGIDLAMATRSVSPTVIITSAETMAAMHQKEIAGIAGPIQRFGKYTQAQAMEAGRMPTDGLLFKILAPSASSTKPGKLRLILTSDRIGAGTPALSSTMLSDLRIFTRSRIVYALTAARVAGAVAQTNVFDYRRDNGTGHSQFGVPLSSVEVKLVNRDDSKCEQRQPEGEIVVSGPAVSGGETRLGVQGRIREDCTLAYA